MNTRTISIVVLVTALLIEIALMQAPDRGRDPWEKEKARYRWSANVPKDATQVHAPAAQVIPIAKKALKQEPRSK